jgi:hypothetical protein
MMFIVATCLRDVGGEMHKEESNVRSGFYIARSMSLHSLDVLQHENHHRRFGPLPRQCTSYSLLVRPDRSQFGLTSQTGAVSIPEQGVQEFSEELTIGGLQATSVFFPGKTFSGTMELKYEDMKALNPQSVSNLPSKAGNMNRPSRKGPA